MGGPSDRGLDGVLEAIRHILVPGPHPGHRLPDHVRSQQQDEDRPEGLEVDEAEVGQEQEEADQDQARTHRPPAFAPSLDRLGETADDQDHGPVAPEVPCLEDAQVVEGEEEAHGHDREAQDQAGRDATEVPLSELVLAIALHGVQSS